MIIWRIKLNPPYKKKSCFHNVNTTSFVLFRYYCAEFLAELVELLKHLLCEVPVEGSLVALRMVGSVLEVVVKLYCFVDYLADLVHVLVWVERNEKRAVINELCNEILDVFLKNSKVHGKYVFNLL